MLVFSVSGEVSAKVMLVVRVLLDGVEQRNLLLLVVSQAVDTVVSLSIFEVHLIDNLLDFSSVQPVLGFKGRVRAVIFEPLRSLRVHVL